MPLQTIRRALPYEYSKYRKHLKDLDSNSKHLRFGVSISDEVIDTLCDKFERNPTEHVLYVIEDSNLDFIAVGHISTEGKEMELAFSVLKEHQGKGLGNLLMKRCILHCRTHGILKGCMVCLSTNSVIKHLCIKYGIHIETEVGETLADIHLDHPSLSTYVASATEDNLAILDYMGKRFKNPWTSLLSKTL